MPRFHLSVWNKDMTRIEWEAAKVSTGGTFLVAIDLQMGGIDPDIAKNYEASIRALSEGARGRQSISQNIWLFDKDDQLEGMFQTLVDTLGVNHSFSVVELGTGEGLGYSAKRREVYEIAPTH
jgi:hypothetical protein